MASITIRDLEDTLESALREQAAAHGRSVEEEARDILSDSLGFQPARLSLADAIRARFAPLGGVELELPPREPIRFPPRFDD